MNALEGLNDGNAETLFIIVFLILFTTTAIWCIRIFKHNVSSRVPFIIFPAIAAILAWCSCMVYDKPFDLVPGMAFAAFIAMWMFKRGQMAHNREQAAKDA